MGSRGGQGSPSNSLASLRDPVSSFSLVSRTARRQLPWGNEEQKTTQDGDVIGTSEPTISNISSCRTFTNL